MKPMVNKSLDQMSSLQRTAESFRYMVLTVEFWLSPEKQLRKWVKTNARVAVFIAAPTFMVFPIVSKALWELSSWTDALTSIAAKLIFLPILVLLALISISVVLKVLRVFKP